jgi:hypothetical protein
VPDRLRGADRPLRLLRSLWPGPERSLSLIVAVGVAALVGAAVLALPARACELSAPDGTAPDGTAPDGAAPSGVIVLVGPGVHGGF